MGRLLPRAESGGFYPRIGSQTLSLATPAATPSLLRSPREPQPEEPSRGAWEPLLPMGEAEPSLLQWVNLSLRGRALLLLELRVFSGASSLHGGGALLLGVRRRLSAPPGCGGAHQRAPWLKSERGLCPYTLSRKLRRFYFGPRIISTFRVTVTRGGYGCGYGRVTATVRVTVRV